MECNITPINPFTGVGAILCPARVVCSKNHKNSRERAILNPLNAKIVAANFSCSAKVVFVEEKRWLCQSTEAPCNALISVLRLYSKVYLPLLPSFYIHTYNIVRSVNGKS